ncbi:inositol monophosphatase family protein [Lentzea sp. NPDC051213]|uniref:inositol monophosphatase family protein n=1 Tax=Lentzea sp. NPDC051213 TaxID=3364126 RepID=UPI0037B4DF9B
MPIEETPAMPTLDLDRALPAAQRAIDLAVQYVLHHQPTRISTKGDRDLVTNIDPAIEKLIRDLLHNWDPQIGFLGEEHGAFGDQNTYWVLDPIDGTINYAHGSPLFAIALALVHEHQPILGITALPFLGARYWAVQGQGAYRDGDRISVSTTSELHEAVIGMCDYGSGPNAEVRDRLCADLDHRLTGRAQGVRRLGTTALELVWVADGTLDASVLFGNRTWDTASGAIIAREAGALVLDVDGQPHTTLSGSVLATTPALADVILPMMEVARDTLYWPQPGIS